MEARHVYFTHGSFRLRLQRHMDERHEETKGPRGWLLPSRRSISWLIYLSDTDIQGGELRSFSQEQFTSKPGELEVGSNDGNLQIGWFDYDGSTLPVYLDSWYKPTGIKAVDVDPYCVLYIVRDGKKEFITRPWINTMVTTSFADFIKAQTVGDDGPGLFTTAEHANGFKLIEDRQLWDNGMAPAGSFVEDIVPKRGSIVMFDSVSVPHEVLVLKTGVRPAVAGWFHEQTQPMPEGFF